MHFYLDGKMLEMTDSLWLPTNRFMNVSGKSASPAMTCLTANRAEGVGPVRKQV